MWEAYIQLGLRHILDIRAYDHLLFILALCAIYRVSDWKKLLIPVTAFTIGHSVSLALSSLDQVKFNAELIEFLIPLTILATAISNILYERSSKTPSFMHYGLTLIFGIIHGFGFANYFKAILGGHDQIWAPLLSFNIGVELGQLIIVSVIFVLTYLVSRVLQVQHHYWNYTLSTVAGLASIWLMIK